MAASAGALDAVFAHIDGHKDAYIEVLREAVAIPSISAEPAHRPDCIHMMEWAKAKMEKMGCASASLHPLGDEKPGLPLPPILVARFGTDASKKTICVYGHLDVQPAAKADGWDTEPFELTLKDGKMYGRGSTDDKGPVLAWLHAIEAMAATGMALPVNVLFVLEGMEESGSEGLKAFIDANAGPGKLLGDVDYICISDNYWLSQKPCLTYGLRGLTYFSLEVNCAAKDLHSGVYGGPLREAMVDLSKALASLHDDDGNIAIAGIMDAVRPVTAEEEALYKDIEFDPEAFRKECGAPKALRFADKQSVLMARWRFPSLSIHGIEGAFAGPGAKTVLPRTVTGKFSIRLVPDMTPEAVEAAVRTHIDGVFARMKTPNTYKLTLLSGAKAWLSDVNGPNYAAARRAIKRVHGAEPDMTREGGSIPITLWLQEATGKSVMLLPIGACDDSAHSQNEKFDVANYINGTKCLAAYLLEISKEA